MPEPEKRFPVYNSMAEAQAEKAAIHKSWMWIAKLGAATFGTIIAPIIVALVLKTMDGPPPPPNDSTRRILSSNKSLLSILEALHRVRGPSCW